MSNYIFPSYSNLVRYFLRSSLGTLQISEPINWKEDEKELKRSAKVHGVFINLSNNLEFPRGDVQNNGGYDYLLQIYNIEGINAQVLLVKEVKEGNTWVESYRGYLDFSTFSRQNNIAKIKFNESGLYEKIKARQSEKIELNRTTTIDGDDLELLETETVALDGREILIIDQLDKSTNPNGLDIPSGDNNVFLGADFNQLWFNHINGGNYEAIVLPLTQTVESDGNVSTILEYDIPEDGISYENGRTTATMFYDAVIDIVLNVDFNIELEVKYNEGISIGTIRLDLVRYSGAPSFIFEEYETLGTCTAELGSKIIYRDSNKKIILNSGDSLCLAVHSTRNNNDIITVRTNTAEVIIKDPTYYPTSTAKFVLPHEALNRITHIITNEEDTLVSTTLGRTDLDYVEDGDSSLTGITNGFWVRKFEDEKLTTSFKDFIESFESIWQIGYGIERKGFKENVRVEKLDYFYQNEVLISIGQPKDIKRTVAKDHFYSSLELGYSKPSGDRLYEESMGLDEYNISGTYTTPITRIENKFEKKSKYRADSYGREFARRKPKSAYPEQDTRYDKDVMVMDLKRNDLGGLNYLERKWADDFVETPNFPNFAETGVFSAETATNLRFSPLNCLLRWGFWIKSGLNAYKDLKIRYASTEGNSNLTTQLIGSDNEYAENGEILIGDLSKSLFIPEDIEFEFPVDDELLRTIYGESTTKDGNVVKNYYGLVEFKNEDGWYEYGYLMNLKPNGSGQWKLIKANKKANRVSSMNRE